MEDLIKKYQEGLSINDLCLNYKMGKHKIKNILIENGVEIRKRGGQIKNFKVESEKNYDNHNIKCKNCEKVFNDVTNKSGKIVEHIKKCFPDVEIPTKFKRYSYKNRTGEFWHLKYYDLIEKTHVGVLKCPECDWETIDSTNKTGSFTKHVIKEHGNVEDFILKHKKYRRHFNKINEKLERQCKLKEDSVECKICAERMKQINNTHLKKHNLTVEQYKLLYPNFNMVSTSTSKKLRNHQILNNINMSPTWSSKGELEVVEFIRNLGFVVEKGKNRKLLNGKEIDIIIEQKKLCIEYNGLYYHTENMGKNQQYHLNKTIECSELGYRLIHIFEDEWVTKNELVKIKLCHILGVNQKTRIGARKTKILPIGSEIKSIFLNKNHIQGNDKSKIHLGAFYDEKLIGVMCFNDRRNMTKSVDNQYELTRFATHNDYIVSGLGTKMLKYFLREYKPLSIISFADRRWTDPKENLYVAMGFNLVSITPPDYRYYNSKISKYKRLHKFNFGKKKLLKTHPNFDGNKSERELTLELGLDRIWDCGLMKYEYRVC